MNIFGGIIINVYIYILVYILFLNELYHELTIFQQTSYKTNEYYKYIKKYHLLSLSSFIKLLVLFIGILFTIFNYLYLGFLLMFLTLGSIMLREKKILPLKFTKRVIRMVITIFLIVMLFFIYYQPIIYLFCYIIPILIMITNLINKPIELLINKKYLLKAKKRLMKNNLIKIGITGSYGKTSCKNYLYDVLKNTKIVHKTPKSYNTLLGISKDILNNLKITDEIYIVEMGATKKKDIERINKLVNINIGIITSIGTQHLDSFKTINNIIETKLEILKSKNIDTIIINADNEHLNNYIFPENLKVIKVGIKNKYVDYRAVSIKEEFNKLTFKINENLIKVDLFGYHNIINILLVYATCKCLNMNENEILKAIENISPVEHRLNLLKNEKYQILDDSFNCNYEGFINALNALSLSNTYNILITPGIVDQKEKLNEYYETISKLIKKTVNYVYLIKNENINILVKYFNNIDFENYKIVNSLKEAMELSLMNNRFITILIENDLTDYYLSRR